MTNSFAVILKCARLCCSCLMLSVMGFVFPSGDANAGVYYDSKLWPQGSVLRVCFMDKSAAPHYRQFVRDVANQWMEADANISFDFGPGPVPPDCHAGEGFEVRIKTENVSDSRSRIGRLGAQDNNTPSVWLNSRIFRNPDKRWSILHEFGHVLGFEHEDINEYLPPLCSKYLPSQPLPLKINMRRGLVSGVNDKFQQMGWRQFAVYDYYSVMHFYTQNSIGFPKTAEQEYQVKSCFPALSDIRTPSFLDLFTLYAAYPSKSIKPEEVPPQFVGLKEKVAAQLQVLEARARRRKFGALLSTMQSAGGFDSILHVLADHHVQFVDRTLAVNRDRWSPLEDWMKQRAEPLLATSGQELKALRTARENRKYLTVMDLGPKLARQRQPIAAFVVAEQYLSAKGVTFSGKVAMSYLRRAAELKLPEAMTAYGLALLLGLPQAGADGDSSYDRVEAAISHLQAAVHAGHWEAAFLLGIHAAFDEAFRSSFKVADVIGLLRKASDNGIEDAAVARLVYRYQNANDLQTLEQVVSELTDIADNGNSKAQYFLALMLIANTHREQGSNSRKVRELLKLAGQAGSVPAIVAALQLVRSGELKEEMPPAEQASLLSTAAMRGHAQSKIEIGEKLIDRKTNQDADRVWEILQDAATAGSHSTRLRVAERMLEHWQKAPLLRQRDAALVTAYAILLDTSRQQDNEPAANAAQEKLLALNREVGDHLLSRMLAYTANGLLQRSTRHRGFLVGKYLNQAQIKPEIVRSGTGFSVSRDGWILTNRHVVLGCRDLYARVGGERQPLEEPIYPEGNLDLALLKFEDYEPGVQLSIRDGRPRKSEKVYAVGYPVTKQQVYRKTRVTSGAISFLKGKRVPGVITMNPSDLFEMTAQILPGNSGGPVVDRFGLVVGIAVAHVNLTEPNAAQALGPSQRQPVLERAKLAIRASSAANWLDGLEGGRVSYDRPNRSTYDGSSELPEQVLERLDAAVYPIECGRIKAPLSVSIPSNAGK
jgi:S1-C subfamily serine protease